MRTWHSIINHLEQPDLNFWLSLRLGFIWPTCCAVGAKLVSLSPGSVVMSTRFKFLIRRPNSSSRIKIRFWSLIFGKQVISFSETIFSKTNIRHILNQNLSEQAVFEQSSDAKSDCGSRFDFRSCSHKCKQTHLTNVCFLWPFSPRCHQNSSEKKMNR